MIVSRIPGTARLRCLCLLMLVLIQPNPVNSQQPDPSDSAATTAETTDDQHANAGVKSQTGQPHTGQANRLGEESSPYLLQHAHNPVDWYPWGEEAFARAKREDKLVFLSVGYAACHWCHVMERESFTDPEIASLLNEKFVCIKVDREERPDVDQIYMTAIQLISGNGGWPMSVFLLPDGRPFWGGTYFPARDGDRGPATGFLTVLNQIDAAWTMQRDKVLEQASALTRAVEANQATDPALVNERPFDSGLIDAVVDALLDQYDPVHGGFGSQTQGPKFPEPSNLVFLLDRWQRESVNEAQRESAKRMLVKSLDGMISGAMYDHVGGGFHRYSVDERWQIPHFEKMLYDNAQLVSLYAEAYQRTGNDEYRRIVEQSCDFVLRELAAPGGGFYSSLDADSDGEEGKYYRWTQDELAELQPRDGFQEFATIYRLESQPNFETTYFVPDPGSALSAIAQRRSEDVTALFERLSKGRQLMFESRQARSRPATDTKILTAWNGLMIRGLADAGRILQRKDYNAAAVKAASFLMKNSRTPDGRLLRSHAKGEAKLNAYLEDYAFLASGLIALHRSMGDERLLALATAITDLQIEWFWDDASGGFFLTSSDHPQLILRMKDPVDGATPSGISITAENLLYLHQHGHGDGYDDRLRTTLQSLSPLLRRAPAAAPRATVVMAELLDAQTQP